MYVELKHIHKAFADYRASDDVSFGIEKGRLVALLGPSGSGKTTILRMISGLETPDAGDIFIDGVRVNDIPASKRGIGFVFQNYALFRYMTVYQNIAFGLDVRKEDKKLIRERVHALLQLIGLDGLEKRYPNQLSGGQKQRVAFARALAPNPQLLLLDEPFAAIDAKVRKELRSWLREMVSKLGVTSIFVTHDQEEAVEVSDEIIVTNTGRVEQKGTPVEIYKTPATEFVARFVGQSTFIDDCRRFKGFDQDVRLSRAIVRPEFIRVFKHGEESQYPVSAEDGVVKSVLFRGSYREVNVEVKGMVLTANRSLEEPALEPGEAVQVLLYRLFAFDGEKAVQLENSSIVDPNPVML